MKGEGKTTYTFSISVNVLSTNILFSMVLAGGEGGSGRNGMEIRWRYRKTYTWFYPVPENEQFYLLMSVISVT